MQPVPTVFDRPQWLLLPDHKGARFYANVDNRLEVNPGGRAFRVALAVPTDLFTYLMSIGTRPEDRVTLALDWIDGFPVLSAVISGENLHDLWVYPKGGEPQWIYDATWRVP